MDSFFQDGDEYITGALSRRGNKYFPNDKVEALPDGRSHYTKGIFFKREVTYPDWVYNVLKTGSYNVEVQALKNNEIRYAQVRGGRFVSIEDRPYGSSTTISFDGHTTL